MRTVATALSLVATALAGGAQAQQRPDFSGEWTNAAERGGDRQTASSAGFGSGWGPEITIEQDTAALTVLWPFFTRGDLQPPLRFVYALDGSPTTSTIMMGRGMQEQVSRATWAGDTLVLTTVFTFRHPETGQRLTTGMTRKLSLASPTSLVVETTIPGRPGGPSTPSRTVYTRERV